MQDKPLVNVKQYSGYVSVWWGSAPLSLVAFSAYLIFLWSWLNMLRMSKKSPAGGKVKDCYQKFHQQISITLVKMKCK